MLQPLRHSHQTVREGDDCLCGCQCLILLFNCRYTQFSGFHGVVAGLLVAVKQIMPDHEVTIARVFKIRAKVGYSLGGIVCRAAACRPFAAA